LCSYYLYADDPETQNLKQFSSQDMLHRDNQLIPLFIVTEYGAIN